MQHSADDQGQMLTSMIESNVVRMGLQRKLTQLGHYGNSLYDPGILSPHTPNSPYNLARLGPGSFQYIGERDTARRLLDVQLYERDLEPEIKYDVH